MVKAHEYYNKIKDKTVDLLREYHLISYKTYIKEKSHLSKYLYLILAIIFLILLIRWYMRGRKTPYKRDMTGQVVIVTGCSAGIGKETAKDLLKNGATVIFANRNEQKTNKIINLIAKKLNDESIKKRSIFLHLDLSSFRSVYKFYEEFSQKFDKLDILINNAGASYGHFVRTEDNIESTWQVNHLSPAFLTALLLEIISKSKDARIITLSSDAHEIVKHSETFFKFLPNNHNIYTAYGRSKLANIFFTHALKHYSNDNKLNIKTATVHPGAVHTEIFRIEGKPWWYRYLFYYIFYPILVLFYKSEYIGAQTTLHLCYIDNDKLINGGYYSNCRVSKLGKPALNIDLERSVDINTGECIIQSSVYKEVTNNHHFNNFIQSLINLKKDNQIN